TVARSSGTTLPVEFVPSCSKDEFANIEQILEFDGAAFNVSLVDMRFEYRVFADSRRCRRFQTLRFCRGISELEKAQQHDNNDEKECGYSLFFLMRFSPASFNGECMPIEKGRRLTKRLYC